MSVIWNFLQQRQIKGLSEKEHDRNSKVREVSGSQREIEDRFDRLALTCQAMWELLMEKTSLSESDLLDKVREIDLRDGAQDGKAPKKKRCNACGRIFSMKRISCLYCGEANYRESAWEEVG